MTADEIMGLIAAPNENQFYRRFNFGPSFLALQEAILQVVGERDEAQAERAAALAGLEALTAERDEARADCAMARAERNEARATARADRGEARAERIRAWRERDEARDERDVALGERDALLKALGEGREV